MMLQLDGSTLEGGGQLVRNAVSLSALTSQPVKISRIRGNRGGGGGLRASHTAAVKFLIDVCGGEAVGARVGSTELEFYPRGRAAAKSAEDDAESLSTSEVRLLPTLAGEALPIKPEYNIRLGTPGSVFLIFQALYPYLLYAGATRDEAISADGPSTIRLNITGGTNMTSSLSYDYFSQVLVPTFAKLGLPRLAVRLKSRGWCTGRVQLGTVSFEIAPLQTFTKSAEQSDAGQPENTEPEDTRSSQSASRRIPYFPRLQLPNFPRGNITQIDITILAPDLPFNQMAAETHSKRSKRAVNRGARRQNGPQRADSAPSSEGEEEIAEAEDPALVGGRAPSNTVRHFMENRVSSVLSGAFRTGLEKAVHSGNEPSSAPRINLHHSEPTSHPMHIYLLLVAHTSDGFRLGRDKLYGVDGKGAPIRGKKGGQSQKHKGQKSKRPSAEDLESRIEEMMEGCISDLLFELNNGDMRCLDTYMRDQVVVFQALGMVGTQRSKTPTAEGGKDNNQEDVSLHTQTAVWVCEQMLGMKL